MSSSSSSIDETRLNEIQWKWMKSQQQGDDITPVAPTPELEPQPEPGPPEVEPRLEPGPPDELYLRLVEATGTDQYNELEAAYAEAAEQELGSVDQSGFWRPREPLSGERIA